MNNYNNIITEKNNRILSIEIRTHEPNKNYISIGLMNEISDILSSINIDDIDIIIFKGNRKVFSLGAAIFDHIEEDKEKIQSFIDIGNSVFDTISNLPIISIAAVQGYALGGGFELALSCDLIIASNRAKFGLVESNIDLLPGWGGFYKLSKKTGINKAFEMTLRGNIIDAENAYNLSIVNNIYENKEFNIKLSEYCDTILQKDKNTIRKIKGLYHSLNKSDNKEYYNKEKESFLGLWNENSKQKIKDILDGS